MTAADLIQHARTTGDARAIIVEAFCAGLISDASRDAIQYDSSGNYRVHRRIEQMRTVARNVQVGSTTIGTTPIGPTTEGGDPQ